jgi:hypothetical protein
MSESVDASESPFVVSGSSPPTVVPLESLLSPLHNGFENQIPARESVTESEFNDVALDDESGFSLVALSARQSATNPGSTSHQADEGKRKSTSSIGPSDISKQLHKKSASNTTIRSSRNLPSMLARLDIQNGDDESVRLNRASVDGQHKLQEEFVRLQREKEEDEKHAVNGSIDWGTLKSFILLWVIV